MLKLLLLLLIEIPAVIGWGELASRWVGKRGSYNWGELGLLGMICLGMIALVLNFFIPISSALCLFIFVTGLGLFVGLLKRHPRELKLNLPSWRWSAGLFVLITLLVFKAFRTMIWTDVGIYPLPLIKWHHDFALPLGLANLYNYYGFNSLLFNIGSAFWLPWGELASVFTINILLFVFFLWAAAIRIKNHPKTLSSLFILTLILSILFQPSFLFSNLSSPHTDFPGAVLVFFVFYLALRSLETDDGKEAKSALLLSFPLSIAAVMIKLSTIPILLVPIFLLTRRTHRKQIGKFVLTGILMSVPFMVAGLMTSGCLVFPKGCFYDLPWATSPSSERFIYWVTAWARYGGAPPDGATAWSWIPGWWQRMLALELIPLVLVQAGLASLVVLFARVKPRKISWVVRERVAWLWILLLAMIGTLYWFLMAPDPRFGAGFVLTIGALLVVRALSVSGLNKLVSKNASLLLVVALVGLLVQTVLRHPSDDKWIHIRQLWEKWPVLPISDDSWERHQTKQGESIYSSVGNGTPEGESCWGLPQPCVNGELLDRKLKSQRFMGDRWMFFGEHKK